MNRLRVKLLILICIIFSVLTYKTAHPEKLEKAETINPIVQYEVVVLPEGTKINSIKGGVYLKREKSKEFQEIQLIDILKDKDVVSLTEDSELSLTYEGKTIKLTTKEKSQWFLINVIPPK